MCQYVASSVMLRVHRVEVLFWWFWVLGDLQGAHWEYQKALDAHNNNSYAREVVDGPRRFIAKKQLVSKASAAFESYGDTPTPKCHQMANVTYTLRG